MTKHSTSVFSGRSSTKEFLLNKSSFRSKDDRFGEISEATRSRLFTVLPDIHYGTDFFEKAMVHLEKNAVFSTMAVRLDTYDASQMNENTDPRIDVLETINAICLKNHGIWGVVGEAIFGAFFPEMTDAACLSLSHIFQKKLLSTPSGTVTIGIATYPTLEYTKEQIFDNACKALDHASFFGPNSAVIFDAVSLNISGDDLYQKGDIDGAINEYQRALQLDPADVNVHNSLGVCYGIQNRYDAAMASFQAAIRIDENEVMAVYNSGFIHMLKGDRNSALENLNIAYQMGQNVFEVVFQLGRCHLDLKDHEKAIPFLEEAVQLNPNSAPAYCCLGQVYSAMDMTELAIQSFQSAIKKNPNDADALSGLGHLFDIQDENVEIATLFCRQSVNISPENGLFHHRLGRLYLKQSLLSEAMQAFQIAQDLGYDSAQYIQEVQEHLDSCCP